MNKKGAWVATLTVAVLFAYLLSTSMLREKSLGEVKIEDTGKISKIAINFTLNEEENKFFLLKSFEYTAFNALKDLGENGGILKEQNCEKINEHVIWKDDCFFSEKLEDNFFSRFNEKFSSYANELGLKIDVGKDYDDNGKLFLKTTGIVELQSDGVKYGFEPGIIFYPEYDFNTYAVIIGKANDCAKKERDKGDFRNNQFEDCRNDKDFNWEIKTEDKFALFDVSKPYNSFGNVVIKFALPVT